MIKKYTLLFLSLFLIGCDRANAQPPKINGALIQGGMIWGNARGMDVYHGDIRISNDGLFVMGLGRDAPPVLELRFCSRGNCGTHSWEIERRTFIEQHVTVSPRFIEQPPEIAARTARERAAVVAARAEIENCTMRYFKNLTKPENLRGVRISSVFGSARVFNGRVMNPHNGLDFAAPTGTPVYSIGNGIVVLADYHYLNGKIVIVSHGHGVNSFYLHMSQILVNVGDRVNKQTMLGRIGNTGRSSGPHLHLGLNWRGVGVDPKLFLGLK